MYRKRLSLLLIAIILLSIFIWTVPMEAQMGFLYRFQINGMSMLANIDGSANPRYSTLVIRDRQNYATCVLVIIDNTTGVWNMTSVNQASCQSDLILTNAK